MNEALSFAVAHKWMALAVVVVGYLVRITKSDSRFPVTLPPAWQRWRPVLVLILGQAYAALQNMVGGVPWRDALMQGLTTSFLTLGLYSLVIKAVFNGKEPAWMTWLALAFPKPADEKTESNQNPPTIPEDRPTEDLTGKD